MEVPGTIQASVFTLPKVTQNAHVRRHQQDTSNRLAHFHASIIQKKRRTGIWLAKFLNYMVIESQYTNVHRHLVASPSAYLYLYPTKPWELGMTGESTTTIYQEGLKSPCLICCTIPLLHQVCLKGQAGLPSQNSIHGGRIQRPAFSVSESLGFLQMSQCHAANRQFRTSLVRT